MPSPQPSFKQILRLAAASVVVIAAFVILVRRDVAQADPATTFNGVLTFHNNVQRTGLNSNETTLTLTNVNSTTFGKLFVINTDGLVDAQPLYKPSVTIQGSTHNVLYVATENDTVYGFDADTGATLWQVTMLLSGESPSDNRGCSQVTPIIGVTSTPVIAPNVGPNGTMYVVAMSKDSSGNYYQRLHALDITTGAEQFGGPVTIQAQYPGTGDGSNGTDVIFAAAQYKERAALLLLGNTVYLSFSSHCDYRPYTGWLMGYNAKTLAQTEVIDVTPNGNEGSIWGAGNGPAADSGDNIYFLDANGTFDTTLNSSGFPANGDYGNSFMKISTANKTLTVADYFAMYNTVNESDADEDLGSGGAMVIPTFKDSGGNTHDLAVGAGKDQNIYLVNRDNMGKFNPSNDNAIYQEISGQLSGQVFSSPAFFKNRVYYGAVGDSIKSFQFLSNGLLQTTPTSSSSHTFGYPGATPSISASGTSNAIVWVTENTSPAVLHAYNAANLSLELYNSTQAANGRDNFGNGNKFITPTIANGKVYVGTTSGVGVLGLLP
jgi:hypothetical protein